MSYFDDLFSLRGRTALVTGGARGIGRMLAETLARAGADVLIASRRGEACETAAAELNSLGLRGHVVGFAGDVATEGGVEALATAVRSRTDRLHVLVNNAGRTWGAPLEQFPHSAWEKVMAVNVAGPFGLIQRLLPQLEAAGRGGDPARVVNIGSVMGAAPIGEKAYSYAASKAALHHLTRILAGELAGRNVTVNAIAPGVFPTDMTAFASDDADRRRLTEKGVPLRRLGRPSDFAGLLLVLCGPTGSYITGGILPVDGGVGVETGVTLFPEVE
jgi:NAD(P)-dependent dehydrogenase (short-subunit alcohol dehydrogenase family)